MTSFSIEESFTKVIAFLLVLISMNQVVAQEIYESPHIKVIMQFTNTDNSFSQSFRYDDVIEISGYVEENHGLTKVGNVSIDFFVALLDGSKKIVAEKILTDENGNFLVSIPLSNLTIGKYFLTAEPSGLGYQKQLESDKQVLEFFIVHDSTLKITNGGSISPDKTVYPVPWENRPPLKQFKDGIPVNEIKCRESLFLIQKFNNGMPACVKYDSAVKLTDRGWTQSFWIGASGEEVSENSIMITGTDMSINYQISGGKISSILGYSKEASGIGQLTQTSLFLMLDATNHGEVTLILPRYVIDAKVGDSDDGFFVVLDEMETEFMETKSVSHRTISFSFPAGTKNVEIIGYGFYNEKFSNYPG